MSVTFGSTNIPLETALTSRTLTSRILGTSLSDREYQAVYATFQRTGSIEAAKNILADFRQVARAEVAPTVLPKTQLIQLQPTPSISEVGTYIPPIVPEGTTSRLLTYLQNIARPSTQTRIPLQFPTQGIFEAPPVPDPTISPPPIISPGPALPLNAITPPPTFLPPSVLPTEGLPPGGFDLNAIIQQVTSNPLLLVIIGLGAYGLFEFFRRRR
jgi:hypothetical protein